MSCLSINFKPKAGSPVTWEGKRLRGGVFALGFIGITSVIFRSLRVFVASVKIVQFMIPHTLRARRTSVGPKRGLFIVLGVLRTIKRVSSSNQSLVAPVSQ